MSIVKEFATNGPLQAERPLLKRMLPRMRCFICAGPLQWRKGYIHKTATFGGPVRAWCSKDCVDLWRKDEEAKCK